MAHGGMDYSQFKAFRDNFAGFTRQFDKWIHQFLLREGLRFIAEVKPRTPVDTGDLRNHWQIEKITRDGDELKCWFVNSMRYAEEVEYGHAKPYKHGASEGSADWVPGYFMMTVSLMKIQESMPVRFDRDLQAFLRSLKVN